MITRLQPIPESEYEEFIIQCTELIPESYDGDESAESIIIRYLKDMEQMGGIMARMVAPYR